MPYFHLVSLQCLLSSGNKVTRLTPLLHLIERTREEQRPAKLLLWSEGVKTGKIYRRVTVQYGDNCMSQWQVYEWVARLKGRRTSADDRHYGRLSTVTRAEVRGQTDQHIRDNRRISTDETLSEMVMRKRKKCARMDQGSTKNILF